eukprot:15077496-Alexandrium_andersonii.AAC.1
MATRGLADGSNAAIFLFGEAGETLGSFLRSKCPGAGCSRHRTRVEPHVHDELVQLAVFPEVHRVIGLDVD